MIEVLKQALEALEALHYDIGSQERQRLNTEDAITSLRQAIASLQEDESKQNRLTNEEIDRLGMFGPWPTVVFADGSCGIALDLTCSRDFDRAIEAAHGIGDKA